METAIIIAGQIILCLMTLSAYAFLLSEIIPKYLFKINYNVDPHLGRGLEKFVYPEGRAVTYETHPSIRKFVSKYALFTLDGYKYLQLLVDSGVNSYCARVICFDNKNCVIDVLDISENLRAASESCPLRLHHKTSYVAFVLLEVNEKKLPKTSYMSVTLRDTVKYFAAVFAATLLEFMHIIAAIRGMSGYIAKLNDLNMRYSFAFLPAFVVGAVCVFVTLYTRIKKGIKVVLK